MLDVKTLLVVVLMPLVAMLVALGVVIRVRRNTPASGWSARCGWEGAALAAIYAVAAFICFGWPGLPPGNVMHWPSFIALAGVLVCVSAGLRAQWLRIVVQVMVMALSSYLLLKPTCTQVTAGAQAGWLGGALAGWIITAWVWHQTVQRVPDRISIIGLLASAGSSVFALALFGTIMYGELVGIIAMATAVTAVMVWWSGGSAMRLASLSWALSLLLPAWWLLGLTLAQLPPWAILLLALAGATPLATLVPGVRGLTTGRRIVIVLVIALACIVPVLVVGVHEWMAMSASAGEGY